jgi:hypothetical protein
MAAVYQTLAEMAGPELRSIRAAERNGWPRPIQWDDGESGPHAIDDPDSAPWQPPTRRKDSIVDESVVWLAMSGQKVHATKAERLEIIRRWTTAGRSLNQLNRTQGWNCDRDIREAA